MCDKNIPPEYATSSVDKNYWGISFKNAPDKHPVVVAERQEYVHDQIT
jgi:hypothetical protein